jgi:hypothetical protein
MFFGQPQTEITLPKAVKNYNYAVFGPLAGQKLHFFKGFCAFGRVMVECGCPKFSFWTAS